MNSEADWRDTLPTPPSGYRLAAALFTTYQPPQADLLAEHLLPSLLPLSREPGVDPDTRSLFFGELALSLERLRGKLTVISSPSNAVTEEMPEVAASAAYPWLWRYVSLFSTGATGSAVQHAKLWMFHWTRPGPDGRAESELLELAVSSTNLTRAAFRGQLQAGWRALIPLEPRSNRANHSSWGLLPRFLEALGESAGELASLRVAEFSELLARGPCPEDVDFVASIPAVVQGRGERKRWGAPALGQLVPGGSGPLHLRVCTPFVGEWDAAMLQAWCGDIGTSPKNTSLAWIDTRHPWARPDEQASTWSMSAATLATLGSAEVQLLRLGHVGDGPASTFHPRHTIEDPRWSHAKLYSLRRGRARRLLITSANFSASAWGAGGEAPRNFELGVLFSGEWPIEPEEGPFEGRHEPFTAGAINTFAEASLSWGEATWDGKTVSLRCRAGHGEEPVLVLLSKGVGPDGEKLPLSFSGASGLWEGSQDWPSLTSPPATARFCRGDTTLEVAVVDLRSPAAFALTPLPEVEAELAQHLRDALLLEAYGGPLVEPEDLGAMSEGEMLLFGNGDTIAEDYSVAAFGNARGMFLVVERWEQQLTQSAVHGEGERERVLRDGEMLADLFARRARADKDAAGRLPAKLVAEEFMWRLEEARRGS